MNISPYGQGSVPNSSMVTLFRCHLYQKVFYKCSNGWSLAENRALQHKYLIDMSTLNEHMLRDRI